MWPTARVVEVRTGKDGLVRSVVLTYGTTEGRRGRSRKLKRIPPVNFNRSVHQVFPLECDRELSDDDSEEEVSDVRVTTRSMKKAKNTS